MNQIGLDSRQSYFTTLRPAGEPSSLSRLLKTVKEVWLGNSDGFPYINEQISRPEKVPAGAILRHHINWRQFRCSAVSNSGIWPKPIFAYRLNDAGTVQRHIEPCHFPP